MQKQNSNESIKTKMLQTAVDLLANDYGIAIKRWNTMDHDGMLVKDEQIDRFKEVLNTMLTVKVQTMYKELAKAIAKGTERPERILNLVFVDSTVSNNYISESCRAAKFSQTKIPPRSFGMIYMNDKHMLVKTDFEELGVSNTYIFHNDSNKYSVLPKIGWKEPEDLASTLPIPTRY